MNLIFIVYDRCFRLATYDFDKAINAAFQDSNLAIYDLDNNKTLLDFYCTDDTVYELKDELSDENLFELIPKCKEIYDKLKTHYEEKW